MKWFTVREATLENKQSNGAGIVKYTGREIHIPFEVAETLEWDNPDDREIDLMTGSCTMLPEYFAKLVRDIIGCDVITQHA